MESINKIKVYHDPTAELEKHYSRHFGYFQYIIEPMSDLLPEIALYPFPPNETRPYWTLATKGMCVQPLYWPEYEDPERRIELLIYGKELPPWKLEALYDLALYPFRSENYLDYKHICKRTAVISSKIDSNSAFFFMPPYHEQSSFQDFNYFDNTLNFLWVIPITDREFEFATGTEGSNALHDIFAQKPLEFFLDDDRKSVV